MVLSRGAATGARTIQHDENESARIFHRVLKRLHLSFVRADFGPATISSRHPNEECLSRCGAIREPAQPSCFQHSWWLGRH